jgi:hypothetical protein
VFEKVLHRDRLISERRQMATTRQKVFISAFLFTVGTGLGFTKQQTAKASCDDADEGIWGCCSCDWQTPPWVGDYASCWDNDCACYPGNYCN